MTLHADLTREIDEGPSGPHIAAFFDLDRTLVAGFSAAHFIREDVLAGRMSAKHFAQTMLAAALFQLRQIGFSGFVASTMERLRGVPEAELASHAEHMFIEHLAADVYPEARALVQAHQRKGHTIAVVSSATRYQIDPLARDLGIEHVLCTQLEVENGKLHRPRDRADLLRRGQGARGARLRPAARHRPRRRATSTPTATRTCRCSRSSASRGRPIPSRLAEIAAKRGWPANRFTSRGTPGALEVVRTSLAVGALLPSLMLGVPAAVLGWSWRRAINIAITTWGELGTALAGIDVSVDGEEHLWSHRPGRLHLQPPERRRHAAALQAAPPRHHRRRQAGGAAEPDLRARLRRRRHRLHRPLQSRQGGRGAEAGRRGDARGALARDRARGHAQRDRHARALQEGRVPHGDGGGRADRADRASATRSTRCRSTASSCVRRRSRSSSIRRSRPPTGSSRSSTATSRRSAGSTSRRSGE